MKNYKNIDDIIITKVLLEQIIKEPYCNEFIKILCENETFNDQICYILGNIGSDLIKKNEFTLETFTKMRNHVYINLISQYFADGTFKVTPHILEFLIEYNYV